MNVGKTTKVLVAMGVFLIVASVGLYAAGYVFWSAILGGCSTALFGAATFDQINQRENRSSVGRVVNTENPGSGSTVTYARVNELLPRRVSELRTGEMGESSGAAIGALPPIPIPEVPFVVPEHTVGIDAEKEVAANSRTQKLVEINEKEVSVDTPAPSPR